jgi:hypothetical protein
VTNRTSAGLSTAAKVGIGLGVPLGITLLLVLGMVLRMMNLKGIAKGRESNPREQESREFGELRLELDGTAVERVSMGPNLN